jgi:hypothetical protein
MPEEELLLAFEAIAKLALARVGKRGAIREQTVERIARIRLAIAASTVTEPKKDGE